MKLTKIERLNGLLKGLEEDLSREEEYAKKANEAEKYELESIYREGALQIRLAIDAIKIWFELPF